MDERLVRRLPSAQVQLDVDAPAVSVGAENADIEAAVASLADDVVRAVAKVVRQGRQKRRICHAKLQSRRVVGVGRKTDAALSMKACAQRGYA